MARVDLNKSPYYDDYDPSKGYVQFLAIPGRVAQAREFTALQSTLRGIIKSVGDSILKNGDIIEGCQVIVSGTEVTVTPGKVYMDGMVMEVPESKVNISSKGVETIGVKLMEVIVDETMDNSLRDPAQGYDNYNQPGCNRLKRYLTIVVNDPDSATITTLIDGAAMLEKYAPDYDTLSQTLARRTYDESGSYIVNGLKVRTEHLNEENYNIVVEPGKAYILGYELKIPTARRISVEKSKTYSRVTASNYLFEDGRLEYLLDSNPYVKSITRVTGTVSTLETQSINSNTDRVQLNQGNFVRLTAVTQGGTVYTIGTSDSTGDCYVMRDGTRYYLKWNGTGNHPNSGSTYTVEYEYTKDFLEGTDYELSLIGSSHYLSWLEGSSHPLGETPFTVIYDQYLARKDLVYIDRYGNIEVLKGVPGEYGFEVLPEAPLNTLVLANISNPPNGSVSVIEGEIATPLISVSNIGLTRFTMNDIQKLLNRVKTIEYDQAALVLNDDARQVYTTNDKKGIFTDPIIDLSRIDLQYNKNSGVTIDPTKPIYDMALDLASNICHLPIISNTNSVSIDEQNSSTNRYSRLVSLAVTGENVVLSQSNATKSFLVNPYSMFPQIPDVSVDPAVDNWIEDTIIEIPVSINTSEIVSVKSSIVDLRLSYMINNSNWSSKTSTLAVNTEIGTRTETLVSESVIEEEAITYIRQREITVEGSDFPSGIDNIQCYFDGVLVPLTPIEGTQAGTVEGSVKANAEGYVKAKFTIPAGRRTGTRDVVLKSDIEIEGYVTEGFTLYIAQGLARKIERTVSTVTTVLLERISLSTITGVYVDPVGQSFVLDRMSLIKGIDVYFESKPDTNTPIICELREVINGSITPTVYAHTSLRPSQVSISSDSSVPTRFNFADPVLLEENKEYAFTLRSLSNAYRVWVSELGGRDVLSEELIIRNPILEGVFFSSSNNSTWTAHQTTDMKFNLIEDIYANNSVVNFEKLTVNQASRLLLAADAALAPNTSVDWTYGVLSAEGTIVYKSITPYNLTLLGDSYDEISLRATLSRTTTNNLSPLLALDTVCLIDSHYKTEGCYISKNVSGLDEYTEVNILLDVYTPPGTSFVVKISPDNGETLITLDEDVTSTPMNYNWIEKSFTGKVPTDSTQFRVFIEAKSDTSRNTPAFRRLRAIMS